MTLFSTLLAIAAAMCFVALILWVLFGQITVRKLRKNPIIKHELGMEFYSGYDIVNVAGALSLPRWMNRKLRSGRLAYLYADADLLYQHTSLFDRILARIFFIPFMVSFGGLAALAILDWWGVFG